MGEANRRNQMGLLPRGMQQPRQLPQQPIQMQVNIEDTAEHICPCGCKYFLPVVLVRKVSALISPTGQEMIAQLPALVCLECHEPMDVKGKAVADKESDTNGG